MDDAYLTKDYSQQEIDHISLHSFGFRLVPWGYGFKCEPVPASFFSDINIGTTKQQE